MPKDIEEDVAETDVPDGDDLDAEPDEELDELDEDDDALLDEDDDDLDEDDAELVEDGEEDEGGTPRTSRSATDSDESPAEDEEEEELDDDDVEASLDVILKERLVVEDEEEDEDEDEAADVEDRVDGNLRVLPKQPGEFVCQSCFLVKNESQLADSARMLCRDCV